MIKLAVNIVIMNEIIDTSLKMKKVEMMKGVSYDSINEQGLVITIKGEKRLLEVDNIIVCAGQVSVNSLVEELKATKANVHSIGGAKLSSSIDAKRAIKEGLEVAAGI